RRGSLTQLQWSADAAAAATAAAAAAANAQPVPVLLRGWRAKLKCSKGHPFWRDFQELQAGLWCSVCLASSFFTPVARLRAISRDKQLEQAIREKQQQLLQEARQQMAASAAAAAAAASRAGPVPPCYKPHRVQQQRQSASAQNAAAAIEGS
ncbi:DnaJ domain-containing protein, putative, partial [Eimeria tenella]